MNVCSTYYCIYSYQLLIEKNIYLTNIKFYNNKCNYVVNIVISLMVLLKKKVFVGVYFLIEIINSLFLI